MFGRYRLLGRLAAGGMAEVWAAQLLAPGGFCKPMVIKRVLPELATSPSFLRMLMTEARVAARLSHTNICAVFELGEVDGEYYIAMEYLRGAPLTRLLKAGGALPAADAVAITAQACEGLHYAHEQRDAGGNLLGLVHRDVSPQNLFVTGDGVVKLLDFGIAKVDDGSSERTEAGKVKGKLPYMSPEQLMAEPLDRRSDVWSLGVVLWEMLTGRRLFGGVGPAATVDAIRSAKVPALASVGVDAPRLDQVLARALCRSKEFRPASAAELRRLLLEALAPAPPAAADEIAQHVWSRCGGEVRESDQLFEEETAPEVPDVVERLPLRAEATSPSIELVQSPFDDGDDSDADVVSVLGGLTADTVPSIPVAPLPSRPEPTVPVVVESFDHDDDEDEEELETRLKRPRRVGFGLLMFAAAAAAGAVIAWWLLRGPTSTTESSEPPAIAVTPAPAPAPPPPPPAPTVTPVAP
ncbi:MAG TPA: serine/threonine-protein kinase, partial [Kofleriaceae bacterium]|nr:serine/threonine-protein kinase [Kofleriaceae bacterium]